MAKQNMLKFNIKNVKYNAEDEVKDLTFATSLTLESEYNEEKIYGDGEVILVLANDQGKTGTLGVIDIDNQFEKDLGRLIELEGGTLAEIQQHGSVPVDIYYEVDAYDEGIKIVIKNWLLGVTVGKASEGYEQTTDETNFGSFEYPLTISGVNLKATSGSDDYVDAKGNKVKVFRATSYPGDTGYETFGASVPTLKVKTGA